MAQFIYTTSLSIWGPWLIDNDRLDDLDSILEEEWNRLAKRTERLLAAQVDAVIEKIDKNTSSEFRKLERTETELKSRRKEAEESLRTFGRYKNRRELTIYLRKNKRIKVNSFKEAAREHDLLGEVANGFEFDMECGEITCKIGLAKYSIGNSLEFAVSPETLPESREFFATLHRWAQSNRPSKWQQLWKLLNGLQWVGWMFALWIGLFAISDGSKSLYKEEARKLLQDGVSKEDQSRAIEILLALQTDYHPPTQSTGIPLWFKLILYGGFIVCLATSFAPKNTLGIGRGQESINRWRFWMRFVFYLVPSFIFFNIVWPLLSNRLFPK